MLAPILGRALFAACGEEGEGQAVNACGGCAAREGRRSGAYIIYRHISAGMVVGPSPEQSRIGDDDSLLAGAPRRRRRALVADDPHFKSAPFPPDVDVVGEPATAALLPDAVLQREREPVARILDIFEIHAFLASTRS